MLSLATQLPRNEAAPPDRAPGAVAGGADGVPPIVILDGSRADEPASGVWTRLAGRLAPVCRRFGPGAEVEQVVDALLAEVDARESGRGDRTPRFLIVHGLGRFRELRKDDDEFGFGLDRDKPASPGKRFADLLRRGPLVGVHTLLWCDSYNNLTRWLARESLREFETRIVFPMSANDSSNLIESPVAARLGPHRAYLYEEATGALCKFRPYLGGSEEWFRWVDSFEWPGERRGAGRLAEQQSPSGEVGGA